MPPRRRSLSAPYPAWRRSARWTEPCSRSRRLQKSPTITQPLTNSAASIRQESQEGGPTNARGLRRHRLSPHRLALPPPLTFADCKGQGGNSCAVVVLEQSLRHVGRGVVGVVRSHVSHVQATGLHAPNKRQCCGNVNDARRRDDEPQQHATTLPHGRDVMSREGGHTSTCT